MKQLNIMICFEVKTWDI